MEETVQFILQRYGLWELVESGGQEVNFAASMDGAELSWKVSQVMAGIKLTNAQTKDQKNNNTFWLGDDGITGVQSHDVCFPLKVVIGRQH